MINKIRPVLLVLLIFNTIQVLGSENANLIKKYSDFYDANINKYETEFSQAKLRGCIDYINKLQDKQKKLQISGDLDGWEAINKELTRFRDKPIITKKDSAPASLRLLQDAYTTHLNNLELTKNRQIIAIKNKYITKLEYLKLKWTKSGNFQDAFLARDEIKRVNQSDIIKSSTNIVESNSNKTGQSKAQTSYNTAKDSKTPEAPTEIITHIDKSIIHPPGATPKTKSSYKRMPLTRTKLSPWPSDIYASIAISSNKSSGSSRTGYSKTTNSSDERNIRVSLKTSSKCSLKTNLHLLLEYYTKTASGNAEPYCIKTKNIPIPYLDKQTLIVDVSPVSVESTSISYGNYRGYRRGHKFLGCIISIIDSNNKMLYQGVTVRSLNNLAKHIDVNTNIDELRIKYHAARERRDRIQSAYESNSSNNNLRSARDNAVKRYEEASRAYHVAQNAECNTCQ